MNKITESNEIKTINVLGSGGHSKCILDIIYQIIQIKKNNINLTNPTILRYFLPLF